MIDQFKATIQSRGGLSRANRFEVIIPLPRTIPEADRGRDLTLLCESTIFPGKQILTQEWAIYSHTIKVPYGFLQEDINCIFNITNDYYAKNVFDQWQNKVIDNERYLINYDEDFKTDITLRQLDETDRPIYEYILYGAYPLSVQPIVFDNNADQQTQKLSVSFAYNNFEQRKAR